MKYTIQRTIKKFFPKYEKHSEQHIISKIATLESFFLFHLSSVTLQLILCFHRNQTETSDEAKKYNLTKLISCLLISIILSFIYLMIKFKKWKHLSFRSWQTKSTIILTFFFEILLFIHVELGIESQGNQDMLITLFYLLNKATIISFNIQNKGLMLFFLFFCNFYLNTGFFVRFPSDYVFFFGNYLINFGFIIYIFLINRKKIQKKFSIRTKHDLNYDIMRSIFDALPEGILLVEYQPDYNKNMIDYYNSSITKVLEEENLQFSSIEDFNRSLNCGVLFDIKERTAKSDKKITETNTTLSNNQKTTPFLEVLKSFQQNMNKDESIFLAKLQSEISIELVLKKINLREKNYLLIIFRSLNNIETIAKLKQKDDFKSRLLSSFSHELKTPLNSAIPCLEMLMVQPDIPEEYKRVHLRNSLCSLKLLQNTLNDIIDFSLIYSGKMILKVEKFSIMTLIQEIAELISPLAQAKKLAFQIRLEHDYMMLCSDYNRTKQLVLNLLRNAVQFTEKGEISISITLTDQSDGLFVDIKDTGIGISEDKLAALNDIFQNIEELGEASLQINTTGSGFGLILSQNLALLLGKSGQGITIESVYGEGSSFSFFLIDKLSEMKIMSDKTSSIITEHFKMNSSKYIWLNSYKVEFLRHNIHKSFNRIGSGKSEPFDAVNHADSMTSSLDNHIQTMLNEMNKNNDVKFVQKDETISDRREKSLINMNHRNMEFITDSADNSFTYTDFSKKSGSHIYFKSYCSCPKILVVDDDIFNITTLELMLRNLKLNCEKAINGHKALEIIRSRLKNPRNCCKCFNLVLMDYQMPIMDGIEATKELMDMMHHGELSSNLIIIGCTAFVGKDEIDRCFNVGMKDVIFKPLSKKTLEGVILKWTPSLMKAV